MQKAKWRVARFVTLVAIAIVLIVFREKVKIAGRYVRARLEGKATVGSRVAQFSESVHARLQPDFERARLPYPPASCVLLAFKDERCWTSTRPAPIGSSGW